MHGLAGLIGIAVAALLFGIAAHGISQSWRQSRALADNAEQIFRSPASFVAGNSRGDVSVVAFFDYNCSECRKDAAVLQSLIAEDRGIRLVLKEVAVLGPDSEAVARIALASMRQGKYWDLYGRFASERGAISKDRALSIATEAGLDRGRLETDMRDPAAEAALAQNLAVARSLGAEALPFYLVGDRRLRSGAKDLHAELAKGVADIRTHGCRAAC